MNEIKKREIKALLADINNEVEAATLVSMFEQYYINASEMQIEITELIKSTGETVNYKVSAPLTLTNFCIFAGYNVAKLEHLIKTTTKESNESLYFALAGIVEIIKNENITGAMVGKYKESTVHKIHKLAEIIESNDKPTQAIQINLGAGFCDLTK